MTPISIQESVQWLPTYLDRFTLEHQIKSPGSIRPLHTAYSIQHTAYSIQHTAYSIQHTTTGAIALATKKISFSCLTGIQHCWVIPATQDTKWECDCNRKRCNRLRCPLARLSGLQCYNMGHNGHGINLYGVIMTLMGNLHAGGQSSLGHLSLLHRSPERQSNTRQTAIMTGQIGDKCSGKKIAKCVYTYTGAILLSIYILYINLHMSNMKASRYRLFELWCQITIRMQMYPETMQWHN